MEIVTCSAQFVVLWNEKITLEKMKKEKKNLEREWKTIMKIAHKYYIKLESNFLLLSMQCNCTPTAPQPTNQTSISD